MAAMRNFRIKLRDQLPATIPYDPPVYMRSPYEGRLHWRIMLLEASIVILQQLNSNQERTIENYWKRIKELEGCK
jgi:hypothetical protein